MNNEEREFNAKLAEVITINKDEAGMVISGNEVTLYFGADADENDKSTCSPSDILVLALGRIISHHSDFLMKVIDEVGSIQEMLEHPSDEESVSSDTDEVDEILDRMGDTPKEDEDDSIPGQE